MRRLMILVAPVVLLLAGCSTTNVRMYNAAGLTGVGDGAGLPVFQGRRSFDDLVGGPARPYRILGQVFAERMGRGNNDRRFADILRKPAARMGADAIIGTRYTTWWASGLAVKYLEDGEGTAPPPDYTVAVLTVVDLRGDSTAVVQEICSRMRNPEFGDHDRVNRYDPKNDTSAEGEKTQDRAAFLTSAEYHLQRLGYYTRTVPDSLTLAQVQTMNSESIRRIGGEDTALLLLLTFRGGMSSNAGIVASADVLLSAALVSKETGAFVWENTAEGSYGTGGLLSVWIEGGDARRNLAIVNGASKIFRTLKPLSEGGRLEW